MVNTDPQHRRTHDELLRDVLFPIVTIGGIESSIGQDRSVERIFNDRFLLVIIEPGIQDVPGMVIYDRRKIGLDLLSVLADREFWAILDIRLNKHHPVWFTESFRRALLSFDILAHLFLAESCLIQVVLKGRALQDTRFHAAFAFQDKDDLVDAPRRNFPLQLDCFLNELRKVVRKRWVKMTGPVSRPQSLKPMVRISVFIPS